jgi:pyruvyl transferase EpsO
LEPTLDGAPSPTEVIDRLQRTLDAELNRAIPPSTKRVALVGFPYHSNVGDSAIWAGERAYCQRRGLEVVYMCARRTYSKARMASRLDADSVILLHGGGNFGDLFQGENALREAVLEDFADTPTVQMPQTTYFGSADALERARGLVNRHKRLTLLLRDHVSLAFAQRHFDTSSYLCPDIAFYMGRLQRPGRPRRGQLWLWRTDIEAPADAADVQMQVSHDACVVDWLNEEPSVLTRYADAMLRISGRYPRYFAWMRQLVPWTFDRLADARMRRGCQLLSEGSVVVTNRLHAHILCVLLGIPHVVMDNNYGKVRTFAETWDTLSATAVFCDTVEAAKTAAGRLLQHVPAGGAFR